MGPGALAVIDRMLPEGLLWAGVGAGEDEAVFVMAGACAVVLSAPVGPRQDMAMILCDGRVGWTFVSSLELADDRS